MNEENNISPEGHRRDPQWDDDMVKVKVPSRPERVRQDSHKRVVDDFTSMNSFLTDSVLPNDLGSSEQYVIVLGLLNLVEARSQVESLKNINCEISSVARHLGTLLGEDQFEPATAHLFTLKDIVHSLQDMAGAMGGNE